MALINYWSDINIVCDRRMYHNALAIRGVVEAFSLRPHLYTLNEQELVEQFLTGQFPPAAITILCCHGGSLDKDKGKRLALCTIGLEPGTEHEWTEKDIEIGAEDISEHGNIGSGVLVSIACGSGTPELAEAFLNAGYSAYIAATSYVAVNSSILFISGLLCLLMAHERDTEQRTYTLSEAYERAKGFEEFKTGTQAFKLFQKE